MKNLHRQRGMSILEVLAGLVLLVVAVAIAGDLFAYGLRLSATTARALRDPEAAGFAADLRADVQAATADPAPVGDWTRAPLELTQPDGRVVYRREGDAVVRRDDRVGGRARQPVLARAVTDWAWRVRSPGLVEVRVVTAPARDPMVAASVERVATATTVAETWVFAWARRAPGGGSW